MTSTDELEARIRALEEISSRQEQLVRELSSTVFELRTSLDHLGAFYRRQLQHLESLAGSSGDDAPAHDPPPHY